ncbi:MAG: hypothetical protein OXP07_17810 [Defluviicoccus sp.]|nr:hypothetical protein [Defluviicoccus sp.]
MSPCRIIARGAAEGCTRTWIIPETYKAARAFNADETMRTCKHCGHENKPFPVEA